MRDKTDCFILLHTLKAWVTRRTIDQWVCLSQRHAMCLFAWVFSNSEWMTWSNLGIQIESVFTRIPVCLPFWAPLLQYWTCMLSEAMKGRMKRRRYPCNEWFKFIMFDMSMKEMWMKCTKVMYQSVRFFMFEYRKLKNTISTSRTRKLQQILFFSIENNSISCFDSHL